MPILRHFDISQEKVNDTQPIEQATPADESLAGKLNREFGLLAQLPGGAVAAVQDRLNHPIDLAIEFGVASAVSLGVVAMYKNPAFLGESAAPYVSGLLKGVEKLSGPAIALDWANRIGAPMVSTWSSASNDSSARADLNRNVGGGLVDYSMGLWGLNVGKRMDEFIQAPALAAAKAEVENITRLASRVDSLGETPALAVKRLTKADYSAMMYKRIFEISRVRTFSSGITGEGLTNYYKTRNAG